MRKKMTANPNSYNSHFLSEFTKNINPVATKKAMVWCHFTTGTANIFTQHGC